jgi:hypothetical protein
MPIEAPLSGPMLNARSAGFGLVFLVSSFLAGAVLPRHAPYPVVPTALIAAGAIVGFAGMVACLRNRVGALRIDDQRVVVAVAGVGSEFAVGGLAVEVLGTPPGIPYVNGGTLVVVRQDGRAASVWFMNATPDDIALSAATKQASPSAGWAALRTSPEAGRALVALARGS